MRILASNRTSTELGGVACDAADGRVIALAHDDPGSFALLYGRFFDQIYWYCFGRLGDAARAEDATSQVFAKVLAALPRYEVREASFRSWLFRIAHNVVIDDVRAQRPDEPLEVAAEIEAAGPTPEEMAIVEERHRLLRDLLLRLPEEQRRIVELRLAGLSSIEIGEAVGRTPGAIDTALWRATTKLRGLLAETDLELKEGRDASH